VLNFGIIWGSFGHFYTLTEYSRHFMCIIKFELQAHAPVHQNGLKNHICVLGCMLRSHARNGNEFQTPRHCGSAANVEILGFEILVNPKLI
jgi:hypothetical protein